MGFVSDYANGERFVPKTKELLNSRLFPGWEFNEVKRGVDLTHPFFKGGCEVKSDHKAHITGNVFFEWECSGKPSGLRKYDDMVLWVQWVASTGEAIVFDVRTLIEWLPSHSRYLEKVGDGNASGYLCKLEELKKICLFMETAL